MSPQASFTLRARNPDVLTCIATLSNDEVFTPNSLINEMLDKLPEGVWSNPDKTWLDPCAGLGNFSVQVLKRLMEGLKGWEPNEEARKKHILEKMLFHVEMNPESVAKLQKVLNPEGKYTLNVHCGDFLAFADAITSKKGKPLF